MKLSKEQKLNIKYRNVIGKTFGSLKITSLDKTVKVGTTFRMFVNATCSCGNTWTGRLYHLKSGATTSCGACRIEGGIRNKIGSGKIDGYSSYSNALDRCTNPNFKQYKDYGGRGIKFLFTSFEEFIEELGPRPSKLHSVDRKNNNGNYEKGNVKWSTRKEQQNNRRDNKR